MACVASCANKLMELCKSGWDCACLFVSVKGELVVAPDGDMVASNSVSRSGKGTGVGDASVCIAAAESVFNKLRTVPAAEFTGACTYVGGLEPVHESRRRRLATTFDPLSQVNLITERCVDSALKMVGGC